MKRVHKNRDTTSEYQLTERYADRKLRLAEEKAHWDRLNVLQRMAFTHIQGDKGVYDEDVIGANEAHPQYTLWQFQQFKCGHRAGMPIPEIAGHLNLGFGTMKNFRMWLGLPKRNRGRTGPPTIKLDVKVDMELFKRAKARAAAKRCTFSFYVRRLIETDLAKGSDPP
jgi:hypothetical protein